LLGRLQSRPVNLVTAPVLAQEIGLEVEEQLNSSRGSSYTNLMVVEVETSTGRRLAAGTIFGTDEPRLVRLDEYELEVRPEGWLLFYRNIDRPGMLAAVGSILAQSGINIGALVLGRTNKGERALTVISVDEVVPAALLDQIAGLDGVEGVKLVNV
jgi:D-3-phosphoglycerate dehydrogenase